MHLLALDVALLLPPDIHNRAIALSAALPVEGSHGLGKRRKDRTVGGVQRLCQTSSQGSMQRPSMSGRELTLPSIVAQGFAGEAGVVRIWKGILWRNFDDLKQQVCSLVGGRLSRAEWSDLVPGIHYELSCDDSGGGCRRRSLPSASTV